MKNNKRILGTVAVLLLLGIGGISAYFTDINSNKNSFIVEGGVSVETTEPNYADAQKVTPNKTIKKDPVVTNTGETEAFVFLSVKVPYEHIRTALSDGTLANNGETADVELFTYSVNPGWTELGNGRKKEGEKVIEHIYVYGSDAVCTVLEKRAATPALFDAVTMANVIEGQGLENKEINIDIDTYAIQAKDLGVSGSGTAKPQEVLDIYFNQNQ